MSHALEVYHYNGEYIVIEREEIADNPTTEQMSSYVWEKTNRFIVDGQKIFEGKYTTILPVGTVCQTLFKQRQSGTIVTRKWRDAHGSQGQSYPYVGYMYATPEKISEFLNIEMYWSPILIGDTVLYEQKLARVHQHLESDLHIFNMWSEGLVFSFRKFARGIENEDNYGILTLTDEIDSCWEFYGDDHKKNGLWDAAGVLEKDINKWQEYKYEIIY